MKDFEQQLKDIKLPKFKNKALYKHLKKEISNKFRENENRNKISRPLFFKLAFSMLFLLILIPSFFVVSYFTQKDLKLSNFQVTGFVYVQKDNNSQFEKRSKIINLKNNYTIKTYKNDFASFKLGSGYNINLNETTEIKILKSKVKKNREECRIFIKNGIAEFSVKKPSIDSVFQVNTSLLNFHVKGTKFVVVVNENENIELKVIEGFVSAENLFQDSTDLKKIKDMDNDIYSEINGLINEKILIKKDETLKIKNKDMEQLKNELRQNVYEKLPVSGKISASEKKLILDNINALKAKKNNLLNENKIEVPLSLFNITLLDPKLGVRFSEKNTYVTANKTYLYISSDSNASVYCIDVMNGKLKWLFKDNDLKAVTTPAMPFKNEIILGSPNFIFVLNENGTIKIKKEIKNGPENWASPVESSDMIFIPASKSIFKYDGNDLSELENLLDLNGPLFISIKQNIIFINDLNNKKLKAYDLIKNKIVWISEEFKQRSFMNPEIFSNSVICIDSGGMLYSYDADLKNSSAKVVDLKTSVKSNFSAAGNNIYFTADDGYFYKSEAENFNNFKRIAKADNDKNKDKFLTKKLLKNGNEFYFCGEKGNLFYYNSNNFTYKSINVSRNNPLIGSPVLINGAIYSIDDEGHIYKAEKSR